MVYIVKYCDFIQAKHQILDKISKQQISKDQIIFHNSNDQEKDILEFQQVGFFSNTKIHIFYNASFLTSVKDFQNYQKFLSFLSKNTDEFDTYLFIDDKILVNEKIKEYTKKFETIEFKQISDSEKKQIINKMIIDKKINISNDLKSMIVTKLNNDFGNIKNEIDKLNAATKIGLSNIELDHLICDHNEHNIFNLMQSFIEKDYKKAWETYYDLIKRKNDEILIINVIANELYNIYLIKLIDKLKENIKIHIAPYLINIYKKRFFLYNISDILDLIKKLNQLELDIKYYGHDKRLSFKRFLINL